MNHKLRPRKLSESILRAVRGRMGIKDNENDRSRDAEILAMPGEQIVEMWCGWTFGYSSWADTITKVIEEAYGIKLKKGSPC